MICTAGRLYIRYSARGIATTCALKAHVIAESWNVPEFVQGDSCEMCARCRIEHPEDWERSARTIGEKIVRGRLAPNQRGSKEIVATIELADADGWASFEQMQPLFGAMAVRCDRVWYQVVAGDGEKDVLAWPDIDRFIKQTRVMGERVDFVTDVMSREAKFIDLVNQADPDATSIFARIRSWQKSFDWHRFVGRVLLARRRGFRIEVHIEPDLRQLFLYSKFRDRFLSDGVAVRVLPCPEDYPPWIVERNAREERASWDLVPDKPRDTRPSPVLFGDL